jgi:Phosphotransferase enzyme family
VTAPAQALTPEIEAALEAQGIQWRRASMVSPLRGRKPGGRVAFMVETRDGGRLKLRQVGSVGDAQRLCELRELAGPGFTRVLARHESVLVEEWIEGEPLGEDDLGRVGDAGALLGSLHATPLGPGTPERLDSASWRATAEADLAILAEAERVDSSQAARLRALLEREDPGSARAALIHRDFCAENLIVDTAGRLQMVDNEWLMVGPAEFDLGRSFHRWPMPAEAWGRFSSAHASVAPPAESAGFWLLAATLFGARSFHQHVPERAAPVVALLWQLAERA